MNLELRHYAIFAAVAELGSFTAAAKRLGMSQPSVSRAVTSIEGRLGVALVTRTTRSFTLTEAGETLALESTRVLDAAKAATARTIRAAAPRCVVLGVKADTAVDFTSHLLRICRDQQPTISVRLKVLSAADIPAALRRGECDVALVTWPVGDRRLSFEDLWTEPRVAVLAARHPLAGEAVLTMTEFLDEPIAQWPDLPRNADRFFQGLDKMPETVNVVGPAVTDLTTALRLVELGEAVTFLPQSVAARYPRDTLAFRPVQDLSPSTVRLVRTATESARALDPFIQQCRDLSGSVRASGNS
jgi:DNA-binding transcriptional LysR family regulator